MRDDEDPAARADAGRWQQLSFPFRPHRNPGVGIYPLVATRLSDNNGANFSHKVSFAMSATPETDRARALYDLGHGIIFASRSDPRFSYTTYWPRRVVRWNWWS